MPALTPPRLPRGLALYALVVCLLAVVAAVVAFANGSWLGVVWVLLAGLTSNMTWYYTRRAGSGVGPDRTE
ncbi:hypothetical protein [Streptomyces oceani]|uniref:Uncharacterized protein n=1 Tax=Streptomyces oceani TaxID=1075402 RepID=A0A1E7KEZ0_9ACTN|nr:hypothetical protein [Streptomyces oceani]OEV02465.1 hypothetical protein AN216_16460 [Streptomyces oceani]